MPMEELIRRAQNGDREASERLVTENAGLIWSVAKRFLGRGTEAEDLYQLGCLGFLKAVDGQLRLEGIGHQPMRVFRASGIDKLIDIQEAVL